MSKAARIPDTLKIRRWLTWAAIGASLGAVSDVLLLYEPSGGFISGDLGFLAEISFFRSLSGGAVGILFIPLQAFGVLALSHIFGSRMPVWGKQIRFCGFLFLFHGVIIHAAYVYIGAFQRFAHKLPAEYRQLSTTYLIEMQWVFTLSAIVAGAMMVWLGILAFKGVRLFPHYFPRWYSWASPIPLYLLLISTHFWLPYIGYAISPAGFNLAFLVFYLLIRAKLN